MALATGGRSLPPVGSQRRRDDGKRPASDLHFDAAAVAARSLQPDPNPTLGGAESSESPAQENILWSRGASLAASLHHDGSGGAQR